MNLPYFDLTGKVAIVTGGATGIGRGIAEGLADAGSSIVIAARRLEKCQEACKEIQERSGVKTFPPRCDITKQDQIDGFVSDVIEEFGHIDILVNNSGIGGSEKPILKMSNQEWDSVLDTNLKSIFSLSRAVAAHMVERGQGGKIINVASISAMVGVANMSAYCASKGGCVQLTKAMALEWVRYNIQVNALVPGYFLTPMNEKFFATEAGKKVAKTCNPMGRLAQIEELKGAAVLLASQASSFMTGSALLIDGGHTSW